MAGFRRQFVDNFDNGTVDFTVHRNIGKISESGDKCVLTCGGNEQWGAAGSNGLAPTGGYTDGGNIPPNNGIWLYEARLVGVTFNNPNREFFTALANDPPTDPTNQYYVGYYRYTDFFGGTDRVLAGRRQGLAETLFYNNLVGSTPSSGNSAFKFRQYYSIGGPEFTLPEDGYVMPATPNGNSTDDFTVLYFSTDNGQTWTRVIAEYVNLGAARCSQYGIACWNNDALGGGTASWDYLESWKYDDTFTEPDNSGSIVESSPVDGATDVARWQTITFSLGVLPHYDLDYQNQQIALSSVKVYVDGNIVYDGATDIFSGGWEESSYASNGVDLNGYDFTLVPSLSSYYESGATIEVSVEGENTTGNSFNDSFTFTIVDYSGWSTFKRVFVDHFDNNSVDFDYVSDVSKFAESGTSLTVTVPAGADWGKFANNLGARAQYDYVSDGKIVRYETRVSDISYAGTGTHFVAGFLNQGDTTNPSNYILGHDRTAGTHRTYAEKRLNGVHTNIVNSSTGGDYPSGGGNSAFKYRLYYSRNAPAISLPEDGFLMSDTTGPGPADDDMLVIYGSLDNGRSWTRLYNTNVSVNEIPAFIENFGLGAWNNDLANGGGTATFDYIERWEYDPNFIVPNYFGNFVATSPVNNTTNVARDATITFSLGVRPHWDSDYQAQEIDLSTLKVYVAGDLVYDGATDTFSSGWSGSSYLGNGISLNGYNFTLVPDSSVYYSPLTTIDVLAEGQNSSGSPFSDTFSFTAEFWEPVSVPYFANSFEILSTTEVTTNNVKGINIRNEFDEHGDLVGIKRLRGEKNWEYSRRIKDAFVHIANSSYRGLVNGVTRELGLELFYPICINPKTDSGGKFLAPDPYIRFDGVWLLLYSDFANGILDWSIDRFEPGGNFEHITNLVDQVDLATYFEARVNPGVDLHTRSMTIINQSNRGQVDLERIPGTTRFQLRNKRPVRGTVFFTNRSVFYNEVATENNVASYGDYHVNYNNGVVTVYSPATYQDSVRYQYVIYPFCPIASPVILHDINSDNFRAKMFQQILDSNNDLQYSLPTELGVDIINELISVSAMYWGL